VEPVGGAVPVSPVGRRRFLALLGGAVAGAALAGCGPATGSTGRQLVSALPLPAPYGVPLPLPPVARPVSPGRYLITQRVAEQEVLPGVRTPVLGYDGIFPGPTIESRSGQEVVVRHRNELPVPTVVHLHGGHTPPEHDGWPLDLLLPVGDAQGWTGHHRMTGDVVEGERDHRYPMTQRAATLWYHDHRMDFTAPAVYRGLAGFHLVRDDVEDALPLPRGDRELPLMLCDRSFTADGEFAYPGLDQGMRGLPGVEDAWSAGVLGDVVLVNGAPWPVHEADAARYRLRILNASNARRYRLVLDGGIPFVQIGSDGGLLAAPERHDVLDVAPGERFDVVVDLSAVPVGTVVRMTNALGEGRTADVMAFRVVRTARDDSTVPERLSDVEPVAVPAGAPLRTFTFSRGDTGGHSGWTINGEGFDPGSRRYETPLGQTEVWRFVTDVHHPVHVHLDPFRVLRRGSGGPGAFDAGWKDTVDVRPGEVVDVAVRFTGHRGRYVLHCHNLEHEDMAMMVAVNTV
jgi:spore coat protein A